MLQIVGYKERIPQKVCLFHTRSMREGGKIWNFGILKDRKKKLDCHPKAKWQLNPVIIKLKANNEIQLLEGIEKYWAEILGRNHNAKIVRLCTSNLRRVCLWLIFEALERRTSCLFYACEGWGLELQVELRHMTLYWDWATSPLPPPYKKLVDTNP